MLRKKIILVRFFIFLFSVLALNSMAATYYWVENGGNWNDARHWSLTSGGHAGTGIPSSNDDVIFDENSFSNPNEQVVITGTATCHSFQWASIPEYEELLGNSYSNLDIYGSITIEGNIGYKYSGNIHFKSTQTGNTINLSVGKLGNLYFEGSGSWSLNNMIYTSNLFLSSGDLVSNGFEVACINLNITGYSQKTLSITNSILYIEQQLNQQNSGSFNFNPGRSKIYFQHYQISSLSAASHSTHRVMSVDSSHYGQLNLVCNPQDSLAGGLYPSCSGRAWVTNIYSADSGPFSYEWGGGATTDTATGLCVGSTPYQIFDSSDGSLSPPTFVTITDPQALTISYVTKNPRCAGYCNGWIYYCFTGETPNYTYAWASGGPAGTVAGCPVHLYDSSLCKGTYRVRVRAANGCYNTIPKASSPVKINDPAKVTATPVTFTPPNCASACTGTATATAGGGHGGPFTYLWTPGNQTTKTAVGLCPGTYSVVVYDDSGCASSPASTVTVTGPPAIFVSATPTMVTCFGDCNGAASANATGGIPPFTYLWSNGQTTATATNLCGTVLGTTYKVVVQDHNGCKDSITVIITEPSPLNVSLSTTNNPLKCGGDHNASVSASVSGGTAPYSYSWNIGNTNASIINLGIGTYKVIVTDANGCKDSASVTITQPAPVTVNVTSKVNPSCNGSCNGSISTFTSGGTAPYNYNWAPVGQSTPNATSLCDGIYTLTVTDKNGCVNSSTIDTLIQPLTISNSITVHEVSCNGSCDGKAFSSVSGGTAPYTYKWNTAPTTTRDSVTGLCAAANDSVKVIDANGCNATTYYTVTQPAPLSTLISSNNSNCTACNGSATVTVFGGTGPYKYSWNTFPVQTSAGATNLCSGSYTVTVTDADSCKITQKVTIVPTVTITITSSSSGLSCNGACDGTATANASGGTLPYVYTWSSTPIQTTATATNLCAGTYTITVQDKGGCNNTDSVKFVNPPALTGITSQTNVSCNGTCVGTAQILASGGTAPYTYAWSSGQTTSNVSSLCQGTYTIKLTDSHLCNVTYTVTISQAPALAANPSVTSPSPCLATNGLINLAPTGGIGHYTFLWSTGATTQNISGLGSGTYTVTITDSLGCTHAFIIPVNNTTGPTLASTIKNTTCWNTCDGYDSVYVVSGSPTYTFLWSTGATTSSVSALCPGPYVCTVTDFNGCKTSRADSVKRPNKLTPNITSQNVSCNGANDGTINFAPTGGTGAYNYLWSPAVSITSSATNLPPNTYTITVSDGKGCDSIFYVPITEPGLLSVVMSKTDVLCNGACNGTAKGSVSGGTLPYTYSWTNGGVVSSIVNLCPKGYTLTVTDGNGCGTSGNVIISEPAALSDVMGSKNVSCNLGSDGRDSIIVSGGTVPYAYSWNNGDVTSAIGPVSAGKYIVTVTDKNLCTITDSATITQPAAINIVMGSANASCNGDCNGTATATVTGGTSSYNYTWSTGATTSSVSNLCMGTYTINISDAHGCPASNQVTISQPTPLLSNVSSTNTKCPSSCDGTAQSSTLGGTPPYTYKWTSGATTSAVTNLCAGNDTVIVTDANFCTDTGIVIIANPAPITTSVGTAASSCAVCNGSINITPSGGTGPYTYSWSTGATTSSVTNVCASLYTYTVMDANLCTASFTVILGNTSGPTGATLTISNDSCFNLCDGFISSVPIGGTAPYTYSFNGSVAQTSDTGINLCAGFYTIVITDFLGCKFTDTASLSQPTQLVNTGVTTNATCVGICNGTATLTTSGGTPPYKYSWSSGQTTSSMAALCPGVYTVTVTDADLCSLVQTYTVGQNVVVTSSITPTAILCHDSCTGTAIENASGGTSPFTYSWSTGSTASTISALCAGNYPITVTDFNGCQALDTAHIIQPAAITVAFKSTPVSCNGNCDGTIAATVSGGTPGYIYLWTSTQTTDSIGSVCPGADTIHITDNNGCRYDTSYTVINPPVFTVNNIITNATCNTTNDGVINAVPAGGVPPYSFTWNTVPPQTTQMITNLLPGTYVVTLTDSTNCVIVDTVKVAADTTVLSKPGNDTTICATNPVTLNGSASINATVYEWFSMPGRILVGTTSSVIVTPSATTQYMLVVTDGTCRDSATMNVTVNPLPVANAGIAQTMFLYTNVTIGGSPTGPIGSSFIWNPGKTMTDSTVADPVVSPTVTTLYTVTVTSAQGCTSTDTVTVFVLPQFVPPGGFTPNGDGINDTWILNINNFPNVTVEVFNRWGERLFHSDGYKLPWNGYYNNEPLPVGTYYYVINLNDPRFPNAYTGPVTIMR
jgi:gliding motility-associated-like protein